MFAHSRLRPIIPMFEIIRTQALLHPSLLNAWIVCVLARGAIELLISRALICDKLPGSVAAADQIK
jgi:hypothetical protein